MHTTPCRKCGEPIGFITSVNGRRIPVDPDLEAVRLVLKGREVCLVQEDGQVVVGTPANPHEAGVFVRGYVSHFDTCPFSDSFRRRQKRDTQSEG
jgi:hypothetical protein